MRERGDAVARLERRARGALDDARRPRCPGTNGSSGLIWYAPRVCSTSGKETPAARTSITTPSPLGSGDVHELQRRLRPAELDDLDRPHEADTLRA